MHSSAALTGGQPSGAGSRSPLGPREQIDSPEQVRLDLEIAGPMSRAFAYSIDYSLILLAMAFGFLLIVSGLQQVLTWLAESSLLQDLIQRLGEWILDPETGEGGELLRGLALALGVWLMLDLFLTTTYFVAFETLWGGRTPGKRMTRLRVIGERGANVGWRESLLRNLLRAVDVLPAGYLVGVLAILFSPRAQRLGDLVAGTLVVRERASQSTELPRAISVDPEIAAGFRFTRVELAKIGEVERRLIQRTLSRAEELSARAAGPVLERTVGALSRRIGRDERVSPSLQRDFLKALLEASERLL
jgi:uncharacterized RDD family membrane protein YckC